MLHFSDELKAQKVWGVVTTWSVDVLYDGKTYEEAVVYAEEEGRKEGQHVKVVLIVNEFHGPAMTPIKPCRTRQRE